MNNTWAITWIIWLGSATASFLAIELTAIITHRMDRTLSERIRAWLGIYPIRPWRRLAGVLFSMILLSLVGLFVWHILIPS
jgi:hypothetical protein